MKSSARCPFVNFRDMVRVAPDLIKLRADRSVYRTVSRFMKDEHLRQAFSFHPLLVGGNPLETSSIYTLIHWIEREWGVFFPEGGTGALVQSLVTLFVELGGEIRLNSPVRKIRVETCNRDSRSPHGTVHRVTTDRPGRRSIRPRGVERRSASHVFTALSRCSGRRADDTAIGTNGLVDVTVCDVLRNESALRSARASHDSVWSPIQGPAA